MHGADTSVQETIHAISGVYDGSINYSDNSTTWGLHPGFWVRGWQIEKWKNVGGGGANPLLLRMHRFLRAD